MKYKRIKAAAIVVLFLIAGVLYSASRNQDIFLYEYDLDAEEESETSAVKNTGKQEDAADGFEMEADRISVAEESPQQIRVHVCGAVENAGVYLLSEDAIVSDAIEAAGGVSSGGAADYLNLAEPVSDGEKVVVPFLEDVEIPWGATEGASSVSGSLQAAESQDDLVNINTADSAQLMTLSGIGQVRADAIIAYREANGNFQSIEDIMKVSGIKEGAFNKIKDRIKV